jgi:hypothetical protein
MASIVGVPFVLPSAPSFTVELLRYGWLGVAFGIAALVLALFSVWLPRGDVVDTTVAVAFAAGALVLPALSVPIVGVALVVAAVARSRGRDLWALIEYVSRRGLLMALAFLALGPDLPGRLVATAPNWELYAAVGAAGAAFVVVDALLDQLHASVRSQAPYLALVQGNARLQGWMIAAEMSVAVLTVLVSPTMGYWGLAISVALLLVMRQSFALLLEVRSSYTATVEVLARSLEAYDPERRGHAERVARMVGEAGRRYGLQGKRLEDVTYAALFHDVGRLGADDSGEDAERDSSEVLAEVKFLGGALPVLRILDTEGESEESLDERDLVGAYLIARFDDLDTVVNIGRSPEPGLAVAIGARLYANTRRTVDRTIRQVESDLRERGVVGEPLQDVIA